MPEYLRVAQFDYYLIETLCHGFQEVQNFYIYIFSIIYAKHVNITITIYNKSVILAFEVTMIWEMSVWPPLPAVWLSWGKWDSFIDNRYSCLKKPRMARTAGLIATQHTQIQLCESYQHKTLLHFWERIPPKPNHATCISLLPLSSIHHFNMYSLATCTYPLELLSFCHFVTLFSLFYFLASYT